MDLPRNVIKQFADLTNDSNNTFVDNTVYGVVVESNDTYYAKIDGSNELTPISTTAKVKVGDRVIITVKNHTATATGNLTDPSASSETVTQLGKEISVNKASITELKAQTAAIDTLVADNADIKAKLTAYNADIKKLEADNVIISGKLEVNEGEIDTLQTNYLDVNQKLSANEADISTLKTDKLDASAADIKYATIDNLNSTNGKIANLEADKLDVSKADIKYATIENLDAASGKINTLESDVADIDTLIFGSASGNVIQSSFANAVIAQLGNAQIKSAMIDSVSADKVTAGDIITNNVKVKSSDGKLLISDETIQISDDTRARVQIGKDASGDYSINIWDADGKLMFSKGGITDNAIKEAIIRDNMVRDDANISASKLDIDSLFTEINDSEKTIKSSKIFLDDENQTLDVAFTSITTDLDGTKETVTSQGTQLSAVQGQITSKIWQQDIDATKDKIEETTNELSTKYSSLEQNVGGILTTVTEHTSKLGDVETRVSTNESSISQLSDSISSNVTATDELESRMSTVEQTADGLSITLENMKIGGRNLAVGTTDEWTNISGGLWLSTLPHTVNGITSASHDYTDYGVSPGDSLTFSMDIKAIGRRVALVVHAIGSATQTNRSDYVEVGEEGHREITVVVDENYPTLRLGIGSDGTVSETTIEQYKCLKIEEGTIATAWTPAVEDVENDISDAAKTATNFLSYDSTDGLQVGNKTSGSWSGLRAKIMSDSYNIVDENDAILSSFGATDIKLGENSSDAKIHLCGNNATIQYGHTGEYDPSSSVDKFEDYLKISSNNIELAGDNISLSRRKYTLHDHGSGITGSGSAIDVENDGIHIWAKGYSVYGWDESYGGYVGMGQGSISSYIDLTNNNDNCKISMYGPTVEIDSLNGTDINGAINIKSDEVKLKPSTRVSVTNRFFISNAGKTAYNDDKAGWYFGADGTFHVAHATSGPYMGFHYACSAGATSYINESSSGILNVNGTKFGTGGAVKDVLTINGMRFGVNRVLWSGGLYMSANHTCTLAVKISEQVSGVILVFSMYDVENSTVQDWGWSTHFVPKHMINVNGGSGQTFFMAGSAVMGVIGAKYLYIRDASIEGNDNNVALGTANGITYANNRFVLRYVIGV